eukprot:gene1642-33033_t
MRAELSSLANQQPNAMRHPRIEIAMSLHVHRISHRAPVSRAALSEQQPGQQQNPRARLLKPEERQMIDYPPPRDPKPRPTVGPKTLPTQRSGSGGGASGSSGVSAFRGQSGKGGEAAEVGPAPKTPAPSQKAVPQQVIPVEGNPAHGSAADDSARRMPAYDSVGNYKIGDVEVDAQVYKSIQAKRPEKETGGEGKEKNPWYRAIRRQAAEEWKERGGGEGRDWEVGRVDQWGHGECQHAGTQGAAIGANGTYDQREAAMSQSNRKHTDET